MRRTLTSVLLALAAGSATACPAPPVAGPVELYPTARTLPANLLRIFVYFPRPMARDDIFDHIALVDESGEEVEGAFLENRYDLWSPDATRLTVLLNPGRVKTGLAAHDAMGRALEEGQRHALVVGGGAEDAQGCALGAETVQAFVAGPPDFAPPAPGDWAVTRPEAGTRDPLSVDLGSPHDHLSMVYRLRVLDADGTPVPGRIDLGAGERLWRFTPVAPWPDAPLRVVIDERLEDLAGNRPGTLFDQPIGTPARPWAAELDWMPVQNTQRWFNHMSHQRAYIEHFNA
jgi:hypothetical protein